MMITEALLRGDVRPSDVKLLEAKGWKPAIGLDGSPNGAIQTDGQAGIVKYKVSAFPEEDYNVSIWVSVTRLPQTRLGQVFSAWCAGMDDPLRLVVEEGKLCARIEAGTAYGTEGVLKDWISRAEASGIRILLRFARTLAIHRHQILAWYDHPISTGPLEGTNNKIKTLKRQAYGFRDHEFFKLKILAIHETRYALVG